MPQNDWAMHFVISCSVLALRARLCSRLVMPQDDIYLCGKRQLSKCLLTNAFCDISSTRASRSILAVCAWLCGWPVMLQDDIYFCVENQLSKCPLTNTFCNIVFSPRASRSAQPRPSMAYGSKYLWAKMWLSILSWLTHRRFRNFSLVWNRHVLLNASYQFVTIDHRKSTIVIDLWALSYLNTVVYYVTFLIFIVSRKFLDARKCIAI